MALANVAWLLAMSGERVLVVDWDLEAPGLHRYFHPMLEDKELLQTEGLLDFLEKLATRAATASKPLAEDEVDVIEYVTTLKWPANFPVSWVTFGENAGIDLLSAGRQGALYGKRLNAFSFVDFYEKLGGQRMLQIARRQMKGVYDYILIDSRTGVSDTSGICTVEMPETLVVCFTLNDQSILGASGIAQDILTQRAALPSSSTETPFRIFPVPMRVDLDGERSKITNALALARKKFAPFLGHIPREQWSQYWGSVQLTHFSFYAFEEIPAIFGDPPHQMSSLLTQIGFLARALVRSELTLAPFAKDEEQAETLRKDILGWYLRKSESGAQDPVELAQAIYDQSDGRTKDRIRRVMLRLVQLTGMGSAPAPATIPVDELDYGTLAAARRLADAGIVQFSEATVFISDRRIVERWELLNVWVQDNAAFLILRQQLTVGARSWQQSGKDPSSLIRGRLLRGALEWQAKRPDDFNAMEREYLAASAAEAQREVKEKPNVQATPDLEARPGSTRLLTLISGLSLLLALVLLTVQYGGVPVDAAKRFFLPPGAYWTPQASGTTFTLTSIIGTSDGKQLWAAGDGGTILSSKNGERWRAQSSGTNDILHSIFRTEDGADIWAVSEKGAVLRAAVHSNNDGLWGPEVYHPARLYSIFGAMDGLRLWAAGAEGDVIRTVGGGRWTLCDSGTGQTLLSILGTSDGARLWAVGDHGTILTSSDGYKFAPQLSGTTSSLHAIFRTSGNGQLWVVGSGGVILTSKDGDNWTLQTSPTKADLYSIFGTPSGNLLIAVGDGTILKSTNGEPWKAQTSPTSVNLFSVFGTSDGKHLWAVGYGGTILESYSR